jgi:ammonia channel protein AmtB
MIVSCTSLAFVALVWAAAGYSRAFSTGNDWIGDLANVFLKDVGIEAAPRT